MALDPKGKYLIQDGSGTIYVWSEALAARKDMRPYDPVAKDRAIEPTANEKRVPIEIQGKAFMVDEALHGVLSEMAKVFTAMQEENKALKEKAAYFDGFKERLETDNLDLQEQLDKARAELKQFTEPEAPQEKKGKK